MASLGCHGAAVPHVGLSGASDRAVWRYAYENDLTVITTNAKDFLALLNVEVHPGLLRGHFRSVSERNCFIIEAEDGTGFVDS
jgi:predicted nuclease of predicted toxin-antitoxin system